MGGGKAVSVNYQENVSEKDLNDFALKLECEIIPRLRSAGFERNKYNVFNILRLNSQELKHSAFLAFLMDPNQSGEIGEQFIKHFLILLAEKLNFEPTQIFNYEFEKVIVRREYKNIDILVDIQAKVEDKHEKILLVIENKVYANERVGEKDKEGQLPEYRKAIEKEYEDKGYKQCFLFLTPEKQDPKEDAEAWLPIGYKLIDKVLYRLELDTVDNTVKTLINDYRKMIRSEFGMDNDELKHQEAIKLYAEYREVFDFVFECKLDRVNKTAEVIRGFLDKDEQKKWIETITTKNANRFICFTTKSIKDLWRDKTKIYFLIDVSVMNLVCYVENASDKEREALEYKKESATFSFGGSQWLFEEDKHKTEEKVKVHENYVLNNNLEPLKTECEKMLDFWFKLPSGWIKTTSDDICKKFNGDS